MGVRLLNEQFIRTALLIGSDAIEKLHNAHVAVFGIGGVGSFAAEALVRAGVGTLDFFDNDTVSLSNINRQLIALHSTVGKSKVDVMRARALDINPDVKINAYNTFYDARGADKYDLSKYSYIIDAIDTVTSKLLLIERASNLNVPIVSCMGAGNKLDASAFEVSDIYKTSMCPLAKVMRYELKRRGIKKLKVVYSKEKPLVPKDEFIEIEKIKGNRTPPGSVSFAPSVAGLILAGEVIRDLTGA